MIDNSRIIFLDNNSTTRIDPRVIEAMLPFLSDNFANSSSNHYFGQIVNENIKQARTQIANLINAESNEVIFTSGATEAINFALKGVAESYTSKGKHIITVSTEHKAVLDTCKDLENKGYEVTYLPVQPNGLIELEELKNAFRKDTILVSIMYVNNETGVIQPIKEIAKLVHENGSLFMTDATQAIGKLEIDVDDLDIDLLCLSGHKIYAPKGIGALYIRSNTKVAPLIHGGGHENGFRSGTLNVPGIIALAKAFEINDQELNTNKKIISQLRDCLECEILKISDTSINGNTENRIYNTTNICFKGQDANVLIGKMKKLAISNGSACNSLIVQPSHVLTAMGLNSDDALSSIRFSLGKYNTENEIKEAIEIVKYNINQPNKYA